MASKALNLKQPAQYIYSKKTRTSSNSESKPSSSFKKKKKPQTTKKGCSGQSIDLLLGSI